MIIIALEGLDKSGKATQSKLLTERLRAEGYKVAQSEFHRYDTPTGELVQKWLTGKWDTDQLTIEFIMAADKQNQQESIQKMEREGYDILVLDRYTLSQLVYSVCAGIEETWALKLQTYMRQPDLDIVIDIPAEVSIKRKGKHNGGVNDRYESDLKLLRKIQLKYKIMRSSALVDGLQSIEDIHEDIYEEAMKAIEGKKLEV